VISELADCSFREDIFPSWFKHASDGASETDADKLTMSLQKYEGSVRHVAGLTLSYTDF